MACVAIWICPLVMVIKTHAGTSNPPVCTAFYSRTRIRHSSPKISITTLRNNLRTSLNLRMKLPYEDSPVGSTSWLCFWYRLQSVSTANWEEHKTHPQSGWSVCQKSPGQGSQSITHIFRLRRFIQRNGSPVSGTFSTRLPSRSPKDERQNVWLPRQKTYFLTVSTPAYRVFFVPRASFPAQARLHNEIVECD